MSAFAPVVIFAYRRPDHLRRTLASLMRCDGFSESPVIVYGDGPRDAGETDAVSATREVARTALGDRAEYHFGEENRGLARSVISGVSDVVNRYGRAIVVEDDLELSPAFLSYMNAALDRYADADQVFQVSGYMFDVPEPASDAPAVFLPLTVSWGWATWKRAWDRFDPLAAGWQVLRTDRRMRDRFNVDGAYDYASMLERQMGGKADSWAIRWYWSVFRANGLVVFPPASLVRNTGFDGSGTHGRGKLRRFSSRTPLPAPASVRLPQSVTFDEATYERVREALLRQNGGRIGRLADRVLRLLNG